MSGTVKALKAKLLRAESEHSAVSFSITEAMFAMDTLGQQIEALKRQIDGLAKRGRDMRACGYLQVVHGEFGLSMDQGQFLVGDSRGNSRTDGEYSWNVRQCRLETIRNSDRRARLIVQLVDDKISIEIFRDNNLFESKLRPKWDKSGVKACIDSEGRPKVPWKQIYDGQPWIADIQLSPTYLDKVLMPQNVILFQNFK